MSSSVALVRCSDYSSSLVEQAIRQAISLLGGIDKFIKANSRVLIKPNLLTDKEPESGIVTHPEIVRAVIKVLKDINAQIYVGDSPSALHADIEEVNRVWERSGVKQVTEQEGIELVRFSQSQWYKKFPLTTWLSEVDYLISLPKFKTHDLTILTGAIKNLFGLIPGIYKVELHKRYYAPMSFARMLVDLYEISKPTLTIVDGVVALEGEGPASRGRRRDLGLIVVGTDCVSIDSILALIMGLKPEHILTTQQASARKLGSSRIEDIQILGEKLSTFISKPFRLPATTFKYRIPKPIFEFAKRFISFYPSIDLGVCSRCTDCIKICPQKVITQNGDRITIDYSGCISCFCCQEVCPDAAISVKRSFFAKFIKL